MAELPTPQFHHFIPQFLLKSFSHKYKPPKEKKKGGKRRRQKYQKGMYPGDTVVRLVDLAVDRLDPYVICEKPLSRILGKQDMYRDTSKPSQKQQHIEELLSKLESNASAIFYKIKNAHKDQQAGIWITRHERDVVRKFLFIQKYRSSIFHHRFYHETSETYDSNDRPVLLEYMQQKGYTRPIDVWFDNLKAVIELKMDPEKKWVVEIEKRMFPDDARWFVSHAQFQYMTFCTPQDAAAEFILTDNSYSIFEGPNNFVKDNKTGKVCEAAYAPLHEFAPVSPKLMIVFRSMVFPVPEEDSNTANKIWRDSLRDSIFGGHEVRSLLTDLPVTKPANNYSEIVNGRIFALNGEDGTGRSSHKFLFKFFPIETKHVNLINGLFLDNISICTSIVFESEAAFKSTLEWFIAAPTDAVGKICLPDGSDLRLGCLRKLEALCQSLGSDKTLVYRILHLPPGLDYERYIDGFYQLRKLRDQIAKWKADNPDGNKPKVKPCYAYLDGDQSTLLHDVKQSSLMWKLRVKIDVWSQGLNEQVRERNRRLLTDAYLRLPPRRIFLYTKRMRLEFLKLAHGAEELGIDGSQLTQGDPEDTIARVSDIIKPNKISKLLYQTTLNDLEIRTKLSGDIELESISMLGLFKQMILWNRITFETPGYIRDCGISEIEQVAALVQRAVIRDRSWHASFPFPFVDYLSNDGEKIEMVTRILVRDRFVDALKGRLDPDLLEKLHEVFFSVAYPTIDFDTEFDRQVDLKVDREFEEVG